MSKERWAPVVGWESIYEVSDLGRLRSKARSVPGRPGAMINLRAKILKGSANNDGYVQFALSRDNHRTIRKAHRLVLEAFVGPRPEGTEGCHNDGNKLNNTLLNLRWDTRSSNTYDRVKHGSHYSARKTHCDTGHPFNALNTYITPTGHRACRTCRAAAKRRYNQRKKVA